MKKLIILPVFLLVSPLWAGNLQISGARVSNFLANYAEITFSVSQENTFSTNTAVAANDSARDCAWIFMKYSTNSETGPWNHCAISAVSGGDGGTIFGVPDTRGVFLFANKRNSRYWTSNNVKVKWYFGTTFPENVKFQIMGIEMVYVADGAFVYNAGGIGGSTFGNFGGGSQVTVSSSYDVPAGCEVGWPNGYRAFFCAKYEVSQKQYVQFLNMVDPAGTSGTTYYDGSLYNTFEYYIARDLSRPVGDRYYVAAGRDAVACNSLSWDDCRRYASWCGLRPMTEMEFERAARGGGAANTNAYPWGNSDPTVNNSTETKSGTSYDSWLYYANFVDNADVTQNYDGPTSVGYYLSGLNISGAPQARTAAQTGASPYGIADLAGNLWEHVINCSWTTTPVNGNGTTTYPVSWPSAASGKGLRGGSMADGMSGLRASSRINAGYTDSGRGNSLGFRPARTP